MNKLTSVMTVTPSPGMHKMFRLLRETQHRGTPELSLDCNQRSVTKGGVSISLTSKEFHILRYLLLHPGQTISIPELYEQIWKEMYLPASANTVMVHILNLRRKVEDDPAHPSLIRTVWGKGYSICPHSVAV